MDKKLDSSFERIERSLAVLIDSLTKYNPSEKSAQDLVAAERDLQICLKELETHQNNAARIQELRNETAGLDAQTKDVIQSLWNMRKELKAVTTTTYSSDLPKYDFTTAELLAYARRISRNTLPPPGVTNGVDLTSSSTPAEAATQDTPGTGGLETGASTPAAGQTPGAGQTPAPNESFQQQPPSQSSATGTDLPVHLKPAVNPLENAPFYPWPTVDQIRSGALARYQDLVNRGIDPKNYDPEEEERKRLEEEEARKEAEEKARREHEEQERRIREERERMAREMEARRQQQQEEERRRSSVVVPTGTESGSGPAAPAAKPKQFTFLDGDDDDDDEEQKPASQSTSQPAPHAPETEPTSLHKLIEVPDRLLDDTFQRQHCGTKPVVDALVTCIARYLLEERLHGIGQNQAAVVTPCQDIAVAETDQLLRETHEDLRKKSKDKINRENEERLLPDDAPTWFRIWIPAYGLNCELLDGHIYLFARGDLALFYSIENVELEISSGLRFVPVYAICLFSLITPGD